MIGPAESPSPEATAHAAILGIPGEFFSHPVWQFVDAMGSILAAFVAVGGVLWGFRIWRHQTRSARQRDAAEALVVSALSAKSTLDRIRQKELAPADAATTHEAAALRVIRELDERTEVVSQLKAAQHLAYACLSPEAAGAAQRLVSIFGRVRAAAVILSGPVPPTDPVSVKQLVETIETSFSETTTAEIEAAFQGVLDIAGKYLRMG